MEYNNRKLNGGFFDITQTGALPYYQLQNQNDLLFDDSEYDEYDAYLNQLSKKTPTQKLLEELYRQKKELERQDRLRRMGITPFNPESFSLQGYNPDYQSLTPKPYVTEFADTDTPYGQSRYDELGPIDFTPNVSLGDERARNQSAFIQATHGLIKGLGIAAGTFVDGMLGTVGAIAGITDAAIKGEINSPSDALYAAINNPISAPIVEFERRMEELLPNYKSLEEQNTPWYHRVFTANVIFDGFLKNTGYAVGAALAGKTSAAMLGKVIGVLKNLDIIRGLAEKAGTSADDILKGAKFAGSAELVGEELLKLGKQARLQLKLMSWMGVLMQSGSEARMEALNAVNDLFDDNLFIQEDMNYKRAVSNIENEMIFEDKYNTWFQYVPEYNQEGVQVGWKRELTPLGQEEYNKRLQQIQSIHTKTQEEFAKQKADMANKIFIINMGILPLSNFIQNASWFADPVNFNLRSGVKPFKIMSDGSKKALKKSPAVAVLKDLSMEGLFEEGLLGVAQRAETMYTNKEIKDWLDDESLKHQYVQGLNIDVNDKVVSWISAVGQAFALQYGDPNNWEEIVAGFLTPLVLPGKMKVGTRKNGLPREMFLPGAQVKHMWDEAKAYNKMNQLLLDEGQLYSDTDAKLREFLTKNKDRYDGMLQGIANIIHYHGLAQDKLQQDDEEGYASAKHAELISMAAMYYRLGMLQEFRDTLKAVLNPDNYTHEKLEEIRRHVLQEGENERSDDELIENIVNNAKEMEKDLEQYVKIFKGLDTLYSDKMSTQQMGELAWTATRAAKYDDIVKQQVIDLIDHINTLVDAYNATHEDQPISKIDPYSSKIILSEDDALFGGVDVEALQKVLDSNPKYTEFAKTKRVGDTSSSLYAKLVNNISKRSEFLNEFNNLSQNPHYYDEQIVKERLKMYDKFYRAFVKDLSDDLHEINSILEFKEAVNLNSIPAPILNGIFDALKRTVTDPEKLKLIDQYKEFMTFYDYLTTYFDNIQKQILSFVDQGDLTADDMLSYFNQIRKYIDDFTHSDKANSVQDIQKYLEQTLEAFQKKIGIYDEDLTYGEGDDIDINKKNLHDILAKELKFDKSAPAGTVRMVNTEENGLIVTDVRYNGKSKKYKEGESLSPEMNEAGFIQRAKRDYNIQKRVYDIFKNIIESALKNLDFAAQWNAASRMTSYFDNANEQFKDLPDEIKDLKLTVEQVVAIRDGRVAKNSELFKKLEAKGLTSGDKILPQFQKLCSEVLSRGNEITDGGQQKFYNTGKDGVEGLENNPELVVEQGQIATNSDNDSHFILQSWNFTKYDIDALKKSKKAISDWDWVDAWAKSLPKAPSDETIQYMKNYIAECIRYGVYDFVDRGYLAELVSNNIKLEIVSVHIDGRQELFLAYNIKPEQKAGFSQGLRNHIDTHTETVSQDGKEQKIVLVGALASLKGLVSDESPAIKKSKAAIDDLNLKITAERADNNNTIYIYKQSVVSVKPQNIGSGRIALHFNDKGELENVSLLHIDGIRQALQEGRLTFAIDFNGQIKTTSSVRFLVAPNEYHSDTRNGNVLLYVLAADGKFYPKTIHIKQFLYNASQPETPYIKRIKEAVSILMDSEKSSLEKSMARFALKRYIYFKPELDLYWSGNKLILLNRTTGAEEFNVDMSALSVDDVLYRISALGLRYLITLQDLQTLQALGTRLTLDQNALWNSDVLETNLESVDNMNAAFIVSDLDIEDRETTPQSPPESPSTEAPKPHNSNEVITEVTLEPGTKDAHAMTLKYNQDTKSATIEFEEGYALTKLDKINGIFYSNIEAALQSYLILNNGQVKDGSIPIVNGTTAVGSVVIANNNGKLSITIQQVNPDVKQAEKDHQNCEGKPGTEGSAGKQKSMTDWMKKPTGN